MEKYKEKIKDIIYLLKDNKKWFYIATVALVAIVAIFLSTNFDNSEDITIDESSNATTQQEVTTTSSIVVDISGEVVNPGVYTVNLDTRLYEIVEKAGGFTKHANLDSINQAAIVSDGEKIIIPNTNSCVGNGKDTSSNEGKININSAEPEVLQEIPGVGPAIAQKIIDYRNTNGNFKRIDDITNVNGIGAKTFEKIKNNICVM